MELARPFRALRVRSGNKLQVKRIKTMSRPIGGIEPGRRVGECLSACSAVTWERLAVGIHDVHKATPCRNDGRSNLVYVTQEPLSLALTFPLTVTKAVKRAPAVL